ncbi:MAG: LysM domain-containing protein, partial [bacterium]|nr:LysM domain-containing protein [bacterium]
VKPQKNEKAPQVYFVSGLIVGVIVTLLITTFISLLINVSTPKDDVVATVAPASKKVERESNGRFSFIPADNQNKGNVQTEISNQQYTVKEGDTLESIVIRFYGSFDMSKVNAIQDANQMANPNALSIGQKLIIPMN